MRIVGWVAGAAFVAGLACTGMRPQTYPEDFRYLPPERLGTAMGRMAREVTALEKLLRAGVPDAAGREAVVGHLAAIEEAARSLEAAGRTVNHPILDRNLPGFVAQVREAKLAAAAEPPNDYLAGAVSGGCLACHAPGH